MPLFCTGGDSDTMPPLHSHASIPQISRSHGPCLSHPACNGFMLWLISAYLTIILLDLSALSSPLQLVPSIINASGGSCFFFFLLGEKLNIPDILKVSDLEIAIKIINAHII